MTLQGAVEAMGAALKEVLELVQEAATFVSWVLLAVVTDDFFI